MSKPLTQTVRDFSKSGPMAEGSLVTSSDQLHWSLLHTCKRTVGEHRDKRGEGGGGGGGGERERVMYAGNGAACLTAVDAFSSELPSCRDIFDVLFHEAGSRGPCILILWQIKILCSARAIITLLHTDLS